MPIPSWTADDFLGAFQKLMPRGRVWPKAPDAVQTQALRGLMPTYVRSAAAGASLLVDAFPATTLHLLPEWESTTGLPDPCAGEGPTIEQRRNQVVARLAGRGAQSASYFIQFAARLGYAITVTMYAPFRFGRTRFGDPMNGAAWAHAWAVNAPQTTTSSFRFSQDRFGTPFRNWGNAVLECELNAIAPAHTIIIYKYS